MRIADAPPPGWYPDPEGGSRLRFWEGTDWSDRYRAPPTSGALEAAQKLASQQAREEFENVGGHVGMGPLNRSDSEAIINQVRQVARSEVDRAAELFTQRANQVTRSITPLITQYTSKFIRWFRIFAVLAIVFAIGWVAFQVFAQVSMMDWIGDRIDNLTDNSGSIVLRSRLE